MKVGPVTTYFFLDFLSVEVGGASSNKGEAQSSGGMGGEGEGELKGAVEERHKRGASWVEEEESKVKGSVKEEESRWEEGERGNEEKIVN